MPAELFVKTPERTLFQYLAAPITAFTSRAITRAPADHLSHSND